MNDGATLVSGFGYFHNDKLNLTNVNDQVTAGNSSALSYSPANRLATASGAWGANSFSYDGVGNRLGDVRTGLNRQSTYAATSNRLTQMTQNSALFRSYTYDGAGNTLTENRPSEAASFAYTYNKRNRLVTVTRNTAPYATYGYNAFEQMTSRVTTSPAVPTGTVHYIYDLDGHLLAEADAATGAVLRDYIWLPSNDNSNDTMAEELVGANDNVAADLPLAVITDVNTATPITLHVHADHLGRPVRLTNAAKATVWSATWRPWGEAQTITGTTTNNLRFPGQFFQIETGNHHNWHRTYDPMTGRYTQPDPLGFIDGPSVYAYARSSPYLVTDRTGLAPPPKGERGQAGNAGGTARPDKHWKDDPKNPGWGWQKNPQTGKKTYKKRPPYIAAPDDESTTAMCGPGCAGIVAVGAAVCGCLLFPEICLPALGVGALVGAGAN